MALRTSAAAFVVGALFSGAGSAFVEKHASELDLGCSSYDEGIDWPHVRDLVKSFLRSPGEEHAFVPELLRLAKEHPPTDCYIGLCTLGYMTLLFMSPEARAQALASTLFGSVPLHEQIPLSYWDTMASGWPIFSMLELVAHQVRESSSEVEAAPHLSDQCCDFLDSDSDTKFQQRLYKHLRAGSLVPATESLRYLAESPDRCSWGKGSAYFALAERLLHTGTSKLKQAAKDVVVLGEFQIDRCAVGRNVTVLEQMHSEWPLWSYLRRIEAESLVAMPSSLLRLPPGYHSPPPGVLPLGVSAHPALPRPPVPSDASGVAREVTDADHDAGAARAEGGSVCEGRDVHVALAGDRRHAEGLLAALNSVIFSTRSPHRICTHVFCTAGELEFYRSALQCSFSTLLPSNKSDSEYVLGGAGLQLHTFDPADVIPSAVVSGGVMSEAGDLNTPHNFIRFHLSRWISPAKIRRVVYLDTDVVVRGDICDLHDGAFVGAGDVGPFEAVVAAAPRRQIPLSVYLRVYSPSMPWWLPSTSPSFNAGVMVIDMQAWERANVTSRVDDLTRRNRERALWRHGSQPPLLMLLHDRVQWLDEEWNVDGLGHYKNNSESTLRGAKILHWTGPLKPWLPVGLNKDLWEPFSVHCWRGESNAEDYERDAHAQMLATAAPSSYTVSSNF